MSREPLTLIPALDGLRAIGCVFVVLSHIPKYMSGATDIFRFKLHLGEPGVAIFFVLSGFLMSYLYINRAATKERLVSYAIARFSRIAPAYWIAIISSYVIYQFIDADFVFAVSDTNIIRHIFFIGSAGVFWSITPEVQYYLYFMFVWVGWWAWRQQGVIRWMVGLVIVTLALMLSREYWPGILLPSKLHFFLAGTLMGALFSKLRTRNVGHGFILSVQMLYMTFWGFCFYQLAGVNSGYFYNSSLFFLATAGLVLCCAFDSVLVRFLLGNRLLRWIGKVSFSVYLFHDFVIYYLNLLSIELLWRGYLFDIAVLVMAVVISGLFSIWIELPLCRWTKQQLQRRYQSFREQRKQKVMLADS